MSAFIVISIKDSLHWIVDGIKECRPHNPDVITFLSTGKIKKEGEKYIYEYSVFSKHAKSENADSVLAKTIESDIPRNLFTNQLAQFLHICENEGEQINVFLLDNPINEGDFVYSSWLVDEFKAVYENHKVTNFQLVRVLFTYQIDKPADVNCQVSKMILRQLTNINLDETADFNQRILYIDNQNRVGAAMCVDKRDHDIMVPRMLCDLMMLLSNKNDSYNVTAAISSETHLFAIGYSECMYYHDDVFRYYDLAGKRELIHYLLTAECTDDSLDYNKHPIGLEDRLRRFEPKYAEVPFESNISTFPSSIDKTVDDIIVSFKNDINNIRQEKLANAAILDNEETKKRQITYLKSSGKLPEDLTDEYLDVNYLKIAEDFGINISELVVSDAVNKAKMDYPEYIDRQKIYEEYLVEVEEGEDFDGTGINGNIDAYNKLIHFIQTKSFKKYIRHQCEIKNTPGEIESDNSSAKPTKKVCFLKRLFCRKHVSENTNTVSEDVKLSEAEKRDWQSLGDLITSISKMYEDRRKYYALKEKVSDMQEELKKIMDDLNQFKLTSHCSSVDNLIDLTKLKEHHKESFKIEKIINKWNVRQEDEKSYDTLLDDLKEQTKWDIFNYYYINWDEPFDFIKSIDLQDVCKSLMRKSQPYVNTYTLGPNAENLTSYYFYTDNPVWHDEICQKKVHIMDDNRTSCTLSTHICSKICMFQFLQLTHDLIDGLVDCYDND